MKNKLFILITLSLVAVLLTACSLVNSKSGVIKCTGTGTIIQESPGEEKMLNGVNHTIGGQIVIKQESDCPEMVGVFTVTYNYVDSASIWGTFYYETAFDGGGTFEGTSYASNRSDGTFEGYSTSYEATGSLSGLQLEHTLKDAPNGISGPFEATIRNLPGE